MFTPHTVHVTTKARVHSTCLTSGSDGFNALDLREVSADILIIKKQAEKCNDCSREGLHLYILYYV